MEKVAHLLYVPFTGLGRYGGYRGKRWLRNRIKIFKQFVVPALEAQSNQNFILWVSWRHKERSNPLVNELKEWLNSNTKLTVIFTYAGLCFWDDKYKDTEARSRLITSLHDSMGELINAIGDAQEVIMTIQPSDDCYHKHMVADTKTFFVINKEFNVFGYRRGYVMDYVKQKIAEWNPSTTPPFYSIRFTREQFTDPLKHLEYTGPYKSHEYVKDYLKAAYIDTRGFLVGTHGENISTIFNHPFTGETVNRAILSEFGLSGVSPLQLSISVRKKLMRRLPHGWQRKLRYWFGERFYSKFYEFIRS